MKNKKKDITVKGRLDKHRSGFGFIIREDGIKPDIYISRKNLSNAMDGDLVRVCITGRKDSSKPEGKIIEIVKRGSLTIPGTFVEEKNSIGVRPLGSESELIEIKDNKLLKKVKNKDRVIVNIEKLPSGKKRASGSILRIIGPSGNYEAEAEVSLVHNNIKKSFPPAVINAADQVSDFPAPEREDLRELECFTIDPESAKDFDDAVSIKKTSGGYRLGVHIADVTCYVREDSPIDKEAFERGTSVYLPGKVIPMLPERISNNLCSLVPGKDRMAISVIMDLDSSGAVKKYRFARSIIRSRRRFTYDEVDEILDSPVKKKGLNESLSLMVELARKLNAARVKRGCIDFEFPQLQIILDEKGKVKDIIRQERTISHRLIEEFMILTNEVVASHMSKNKIPCIYRVHEKPDEGKMESFRNFIKLFGFTLPENKKVTPKHLQKILEKIKESKEEVVISTMMLRSLQQAVYTDENKGHFALACKNYAHFTSPIRRYPDLLVHRVLCRVIEKGRLSKEEEKKLRKNFRLWGELLSRKERAAGSAETEINELKTMEYMQGHTGKEFEGIISGITSFGIFVELNMGLEGLIHIRNLKDDYYIFSEDRIQLTGRKNKKQFGIGQSVKVRLVRVDLEKREVDFLPV